MEHYTKCILASSTGDGNITILMKVMMYSDGFSWGVHLNVPENLTKSLVYICKRSREVSYVGEPDTVGSRSNISIHSESYRGEKLVQELMGVLMSYILSKWIPETRISVLSVDSSEYEPSSKVLLRVEGLHYLEHKILNAKREDK